MPEPWSLRFGRFFLWAAFFLFLFFLFSDVAGYPSYALLFWSLVSTTIGFVLYQRGKWLSKQITLERGAQAETKKGTEKEKKEERRARRWMRRPRFRKPK